MLQCPVFPSHNAVTQLPPSYDNVTSLYEGNHNLLIILFTLESAVSHNDSQRLVIMRRHPVITQSVPS